MDHPVSQALSSLLPALAGPPPPELVELAISLVAQSRSRASTLKAEEEIARPYACTNIACERLKQTLALPKIQPRPPCPPKVYQKLYNHLNTVLPSATRKSARAKKVNDPVSTPSSSPAKPRTPARAAPLRPDPSRRKATRRQTTNASEVPQWVMPAIRVLCKETSTPAAPHHIFAGISSIISSRETAQWKELKILALIVVVFLLVRTRLAGMKTSKAEYERQKTLALKILKDAAGEDAERSEVTLADVDDCTRQMEKYQWIEMDWFGNVPFGAGLGAVDSSKSVADDSTGGEGLEDEQLMSMQRRKARSIDTADQGYLQPGLGTMMQDQVDYLSDSRRHDYQEWKKNILLQIDELEAIDKMDAGAG